MSDVSRSQDDAKTASPVESSVFGLPPAVAAAGVRESICIDTGREHRNVEVVDVPIRINVGSSARALVVGGGGAAAMLTCLAQVVAQEAPAWAVSMVVHMATLVTMAMVTVAEPASYVAQQLLVTPPAEEVIEDIAEFDGTMPTTLDDSISSEALTFASDDHGMMVENAVPGLSDEMEAARGAIDTSDFGFEHVPKSDIMAMVGAYVGNALSGRGMAGQVALIEREGGTEFSEKCVTNALKWLASHQMPDGGWSFNHALSPGCHGQCRSPGKLADARNAATGLALLPFLGAGQTHKNSKKYKSTINNGLYYLVNHMRMGPQGGALNEQGGNMYSHGIATIALCEAYAMTHDRSLLAPTRAALNFICNAQDPSGGGWRYVPRQKGDTSVVSWQLMALKSGHMAGLSIPSQTIHKASLFLDSVQADGGAIYGYLEPSKGTEATVAIGLLSRMYLGWKKDNPALQRGVQWLSKRGPSANNMYYNYYATQVMRHWEGEEWQTWNRQMRDQLIHTQDKEGHEEGSWFMAGGADYGGLAGGRLYCTAMATMILEVYYRHMPLYRSQSVEDDFPE